MKILLHMKIDAKCQACAFRAFSDAPPKSAAHESTRGKIARHIHHTQHAVTVTTVQEWLRH